MFLHPAYEFMRCPVKLSNHPIRMEWICPTHSNSSKLLDPDLLCFLNFLTWTPTKIQDAASPLDPTEYRIPCKAYHSPLTLDHNQKHCWPHCIMSYGRHRPSVKDSYIMLHLSVIEDSWNLEINGQFSSIFPQSIKSAQAISGTP